MERLKILIAARDPAKFERMIPAIVATGRFTIVGMTGSASTASDECRRLRPNLLLASTDLVSPDVWKLASDVRDIRGVSIVLYGPSQDTDTLLRALQLGVKDFVTEPLTVAALIDALGRAAEASSGETAIGPREAPRTGKIVTIFGTKGGVGKSFIAANVALSAQIQSKKRCALVDLDLEFGSLAALLGLRPQVSIVDVCRTDGPIHPDVMQKVMIRAHPYSELYLLAAPPTPDLAAEVEGEGRRVRGRSYVTDVLECLRNMYDFVFVDTASNFRETNLTALDMSDLVLVVTGPDIPTLQNTGKCLDILLEMLRYPPEKVSLVLNRADGGAGLNPSDIAKGLQYDIKFQLPSDGKNAIWCANCGRPLVAEKPKTLLAEGLNAIANSFLWQLADEGDEKKPPRAYRRKGILGWIGGSNK